MVSDPHLVCADPYEAYVINENPESNCAFKVKVHNFHKKKTVFHIKGSQFILITTCLFCFSHHFQFFFVLKFFFFLFSRVVDPDPDWIQIQWGVWIRIRNPDPDPGARKEENEEKIQTFILKFL
jgi:hypothetical protein